MHKKSIAVYFSPTGTTEKIAINIAQNLGDHLETYDLCEPIEALNLTNRR
ncbi:hypothetical protein SDC9_142918 [bioreactor metagenome]|uniref:Flavodoxin-like domain-containing protein n=1 Tax=bioreactor metagenome TaxID=1076179 RepID=A0A645E4P1_9ZZZZ